MRLGEQGERPQHPGEARVRALRDAVQAAAARLQGDADVVLRELYDPLWQACTAIQPDDLGGDGVTVGQQFEAMFERLRGLVERHPEPVPTHSLGLQGDARFLNDMADFLTRRFGLE
jgi:hypothetical protein